MTAPSVTSFLLTVISSCACSFSQHKIIEDFSELLDDTKKTQCHSDTIIMDGFCFTIPFIDLYLPFPDLQDDTLNRNSGAALTRETPSHRTRYPSEVVNYFLGTNGYFESVFPGGNVSAPSMSSAESLGKHHHMEKD